MGPQINMVKGSSNHVRALYSCHSIPECCVMFSGVKLSMESFLLFLGMFTFISNKGEASAVEYSIVTESLFHDIPYFIVNPHNYLSDHCQISL